jgi:hypothetical protein
MKGVLFSVVEQVVVNRFGEDTWDTVLERARLDGIYTSLGDYPDSELMAIVNAISQTLNVPVDDVLVLGGHDGFGVLASHHPSLLTGLDRWQDVLVHLEDIIHPEVHKIYAGASAPEFGTTEIPGGMLVEYRSQRRLCHLAEGLIRGTGDHFGTPVEVTHRSCIDRGEERCLLEVIEP